MEKLPTQIRGVNNVYATAAPKRFSELGKIYVLQRSKKMELSALFGDVLCDVTERIAVFTHGLPRFCFVQILQMPGATISCASRIERPG